MFATQLQTEAAQVFREREELIFSHLRVIQPATNTERANVKSLSSDSVGNTEILKECCFRHSFCIFDIVNFLSIYTTGITSDFVKYYRLWLTLN